MNDFPWTPQHGQPAEPADADGFVDDTEASEAAHVLATSKQAASEAGRVLQVRQQQEEKATEEVVPDSGDQAVPAPAEKVVVDKPAAKKPAAKKATSKTRVTKTRKAQR